jgi:hypothetical protein
MDLPNVGGAALVPSAVEIFDTTLRDGAQFEGISLSVEDKLRIAEQLDWLGVRWIEGGYPLSNPRDEEFFRRAAEASCACRPRRSWPSAPPASRSAVPTTTRRCERSWRPARRRPASSASRASST